MYEEILLPYDGSEGATSILRHASEIAHGLDAHLQVVYVADTTLDSVTVIDDHVVDSLVRKGKDIVAEAAETLDEHGVSYTTDVVQGYPPRTIVDYAEQYDMDLIVQSTHGRAGLSRYLIGSVTEKVLQLSSVPVLTARMQPDEQLTFPYETILLPTDGSAEATRAVRHGLSLAECLDATVHIISVAEEPWPGVDLGKLLSDDQAKEQASMAVDDALSQAETYTLPETITYVGAGDQVEEILDYISSRGIHAVVMGAVGEAASDRALIGSVAGKTVRAAPVPVITVG